MIQSKETQSIDDSGKFIWVTVEDLREIKGEKAEGIIKHKQQQGKGWYEVSPDDPSCEECCFVVNNFIPILDLEISTNMEMCSCFERLSAGQDLAQQRGSHTE